MLVLTHKPVVNMLAGAAGRSEAAYVGVGNVGGEGNYLGGE